MNIFLTSSNPVECAQALDDVRLNKMILETGQMLCTALRELFPISCQRADVQAVLYKETHRNHPCSLWCRRNYLNYTWLVYHFKALHDERLFRGCSEHLTYTKLWPIFEESIGDVERCYLTENVEFTFDCSNTEPKTNVFDNYKRCLANKWSNDKRVPTWHNRGCPTWISWEPSCQYKLAS
jgi:hypothetical protein